jgi:hypothetical protein
MNAICNGQTTRAQVVNETIEQYRGVYSRMKQHPEILRKVRAESQRTYFSADVVVGCSKICFR